MEYPPPLGVRAERSTTESVFNLRIVCERRGTSNINKTYLYHVFVDFKWGLDRVWYEAPWCTVRLCNINFNRVMENLYNKATIAVYFNGGIGDWFRTLVRARQDCLLTYSL